MVNKEPAFIFGGLAEILRMLIPLLLVFGLIHWTQEQIAAVFAFSSVVLTFAAALLTRNATVTMDTANAQIVKATTLPEGTPVEKVIAMVKEDEANAKG